MSSQPITTLLSALGSLADDTRLRLLRLLELHELGVGELSQILQLPQPTVSRHLKTLSEAGFVSSRREATSNLYRMVPAELPAGARELWVTARVQLASWTEVEHDDRRLGQLLEQRSGSRAFFASAAAEWDHLRHEYYGDGFTAAALLSLLPLQAVIADLGCGTGSTAAFLAPFVPDGRVIAVDNSPEMLGAARQRCADLQNVSVRDGELTALPMESGRCDAALLLLALTYVPDPAGVLKEAARILKPGGRLVIVDLLPHAREDFRRKLNQLHAGLSSEQMTAALTAAGLADVHIAPLTGPPAAKGPQLFLARATRRGGAIA